MINQIVDTYKPLSDAEKMAIIEQNKAPEPVPRNESLAKPGESFLDFVNSDDGDFVNSEIYKHMIGGFKLFLKYDGNYHK